MFKRDKDWIIKTIYFFTVNSKDGRLIYKPFIKCITCKVKLPFYKPKFKEMDKNPSCSFWWAKAKFIGSSWTGYILRLFWIIWELLPIICYCYFIIIIIITTTTLWMFIGAEYYNTQFFKLIYSSHNLVRSILLLFPFLIKYIYICHFNLNQFIRTWSFIEYSPSCQISKTEIWGQMWHSYSILYTPPQVSPWQSLVTCTWSFQYLPTPPNGYDHQPHPGCHWVSLDSPT